MSKQISYECEPLLNDLTSQFLEVWRGGHDHWTSRKFHETMTRLRERIQDQELIMDVQSQNFATLAKRYRILASKRGPRGLWRRIVQAFTS